MTVAEGRRPGPVHARGVSGYTGARVNRVGLRAGTARARRAPCVSWLAFAVGCICYTECTQVHFSLVILFCYNTPGCILYIECT